MEATAGGTRAPDGLQDVDVLVTGGGQAALAAGYYLQRARRRSALAAPSFAVLDVRDEPGGAWSDGWDTLQLFSPAGFSSLPGWPMPPWRGPGDPSSEHVRAYLAAYEERYRLPVHRPVRVLGASLRSDGAGFDVTTDAGPWRCRVLVNATGAWARPFWPTYPGLASFGGRQLHTADYRRAADLEGLDVLVVGGGTSGAQIAADLLGRDTGTTTWLTRRPPRFLPDDVAGRRLFEIATARIRGSVPGADPHQGPPATAGIGGLGDIVMVPPVLLARRRGELVAEPVFDRLTPTGVAWDNPPRALTADVIVWCTGFRPDLRHLAGLPLTRHAGVPVTNGDLPSRSVDVPGLFFLGYGDWCGLASATLIGVGATARATVDAVVDVITGPALEATTARSADRAAGGSG